MQDRTSHSYRADTPGSNPDMYQKGGQAREAFRKARMSPYIRQETQKAQSTTKDGRSAELNKAAFKAKRKAQQPTFAPAPTH